MRTKSRGSKARLSKLPSISPTMRPLPFLSPGDTNGECSVDRTVVETLSKEDSDKEHDNDDIASHCDDENDIRARNYADLGASGKCTDMDWLEGEICLGCDRGGDKMLLCCQTGCPVAVHEKCLNDGPKFDDLGKFYCPYCWYKREVMRTRELRKKAMEAKKALSAFMELKVDSQNKEMRSGEWDVGKEMSTSPPRREINDDDRGNRVDSEDVENQFVHMEKDQQNDVENEKLAETGGGCDTVVNHLREAHRGENTRHDQPETLEVESLDNLINKDNAGRENMTNTDEFENLDSAEKIVVDDSGEIDKNQSEASAEDPPQAEPLTGLVDDSENTTMKKGCDIRELKRGRGEEEEEQMHSNSSEIETSDSDMETLSARQRRATQRAKRRVQPQNVVLPNKLSSPQNVAPKRITRVQKEKAAAPKSTKQPTPKKVALAQEEKVAPSKKSNRHVSPKKATNLTIPNEKRKRLHWTADEEEMLKEGVQKFSSTVRKNLPWRKILEFGRHVFDPTRTPMDLKDKWRNMLSKESSLGNRR